MEYPMDLKYTENDEWIRVDGGAAEVGITDYAQDQLSDVVYVEYTADIGDEVDQGDAFAAVESVKAAADVYMPVAGVITDTNEDLLDSPELVNSDPYGEAWMVRVEIGGEVDLENLMDAEAYEEYCNERSE